jgi:3-oxoacyl-[acyl-carrier protein] reductase
LRQQGVNAIGETVNVADGAALTSWIDRVADTLGGLDILVANPSAFGIGNSEEDWRQGFDVDLMGTVRSVEAAFPYLEQAASRHGDAAIITMSSAASAITDYESAYGAYKAALIHYTKGVARRLADKKIRANTVSPGTIYCQGGFWENAKKNMPLLYQQFLSRNPMGRMGNPQEVANAVTVLASPISSFISGVNVTVDGAFSDRVNF